MNKKKSILCNDIMTLMVNLFDTKYYIDSFLKNDSIFNLISDEFQNDLLLMLYYLYVL